MTNDAHPFYFKKLTQTSYRHASNSDGVNLSLICNEDFSKYSKQQIEVFKKRVKKEVDAFFKLMLSEDKQSNKDKEKMYFFLLERLGL